MTLPAMSVTPVTDNTLPVTGVELKINVTVARFGFEMTLVIVVTEPPVPIARV